MKKLFMAKVCVRRLSDHYFVHAIREAIRKVSQQKQCPNEDRVVRTVLQEFDWTKEQVSEQLHFAVEDGLICRVTTSSNHGRTKGIPQTAYRVYLKDSDENVSKKAPLNSAWRKFKMCHSSGIVCDRMTGAFYNYLPLSLTCCFLQKVLSSQNFVFNCVIKVPYIRAHFPSC